VEVSQWNWGEVAEVSHWKAVVAEVLQTSLEVVEASHWSWVVAAEAFQMNSPEV